MIPVARTKDLLIQDIGGEVMVYDQKSEQGHCLNQVAAMVWENCDGQNTVEDIAKLLEKEIKNQDSDVDWRGLVYLAIEELEQYNLIEGYLAQPAGQPQISRRKIIKTASILGGFALGSMFPLIKSIVDPTPVMAKRGGNSDITSGCPQNKQNKQNSFKDSFKVYSNSSNCEEDSGDSLITRAAKKLKGKCEEDCSPCTGTMILDSNPKCERARDSSGNFVVATVTGTCTCS